MKSDVSDRNLTRSLSKGREAGRMASVALLCRLYTNDWIMLSFCTDTQMDFYVSDDRRSNDTVVNGFIFLFFSDELTQVCAHGVTL